MTDKKLDPPRRRLRAVLRIFLGLIGGLLLLGAAASWWPMQVGRALFETLGPVVWPVLEPYLQEFPPSPHRDATVAGAYPVAACHGSQVDRGEAVRRIRSLDGVWELAEGKMGDIPPDRFDRRVPVPGLITEAEPPFADVGIASSRREAFWYRTTFRAPTELAAQAFLCVHKAKYGAKAWLNGVPLGEHYGPFTLSEYDLTGVIRAGAENELLIRVGADRSQLPVFIPAGADSEKHRWYPGLWDSVAIVYTGAHSIVHTRIEPDLDSMVARVRSLVRNATAEDARLQLRYAVTGWPGAAAEPLIAEVVVAAGETVEIVRDVPLDGAPLWTPEDPALLLLRTTLTSAAGVASDDTVVRFGMREVEWRGGEAPGFYLNGRLYPLRGTNIAFHRFLEDQDRGRLPWDRSWVERLLGELPKELGWNSFRFHIGRAPHIWYDVADEVGLIVTDEFQSFAPFAPGSEVANWSLAEMEKEYSGWVRESVNHPSIGWWDASNETNSPLPYELVPRLRHLDATRAWESGSFGPPDRPDDPLEEHPYILNGESFMNSNSRDYELADLDDHPGKPPLKAGDGVFSSWNGSDAASHPYINNEYGWLWFTRDGSKPTPLTGDVFARYAGGAELAPEERREMYAYLISEITAFWRSRRGYAGVQHFLYLGKCTDPDTVREDFEPQEASFTCDNFIDIENLVLEPRWRRDARSAFAPVAIYLEKWSEEAYPRGRAVAVPVTLINDEYAMAAGTVRLVAASVAGAILAVSEVQEVAIPALGRVEISLPLEVPATKELVLYAELSLPGREKVYSRRKLGLRHPGVLVSAPAGARQGE